MENNEINVQNNDVKKSSIKWILAILIILVVALAGYIVYDKFMVNNNTTTNSVVETKTTDDTKKDNITINVDEVYKQYINNIKTRTYAEGVNFNIGVNEYKHFILGTDNKLYVGSQNNNDTKIPGTMGSDGMQSNGIFTGAENVVRIFNTNHTHVEGGAYDGLLVLKEDGNLYIIRKPETSDYSLEKLEYKNIVTAYDTESPTGTTYVVDISGNQYEIK